MHANPEKMEEVKAVIAKREHCWHGVGGIVLDVYPPIYPVMCCNCGARGGVQHVKGGQIEGHGPHVQGDNARYTVTSECIPTEGK